MTFATDIARFNKKTEASIDKTVRAVTFALFREVIRRTPVGDVNGGRLKGAWQTTQRAPATAAIERFDKSGAKSTADVAANMGGWGSVTYLTNLMPYAHRIEFDGWSHTKAPAGMVRVSFARIGRLVAAEARKNKV